ncbi:putative NAD-dependent histone deacetylase [Clavispora lusitaniae]|uniref:NAD-dependent histone deacetylase n=1 Tax=Clavispora lusitaniae TaxID=36911 RepID=A0ACD0WN46_CLALS|nr:putative NAD-dependent histone deacetylase [Clavispora lusitaniae]QFZ34489.1 putative NAD-dependent histone deacetylase [Clavispora lusitaniae]QFZ40174.1 putative NAD-dependent histone deacetylase [Clavispora lusitaniae]QFZ45854.1 putative NAD-dependent histone deacetylase [Clavispora lusitaniae]QFZ51516.1 putative NAD-dependent histone deacetylase [Clavispora lusitaniae]
MKSIYLPDSSNVSAEDAIKLHEVAKTIFKAKKTSILTGAGISCNAGIPDFRSDEGLYNIVKAKYPTSFIKGQDLFDISLFRNATTLSIFCTFMEGLYQHSLRAKATETHRFIKTLKEKNKLLRCYTQNIDSLEKTINLNCGIDVSKFSEIGSTSGRSFRENWNSLDVVQLHGNLHKLCCTQCFSRYDWTPQNQKMLENGQYPECENCHLKYQERLYSGKRLTGSIGILRPDIVLYGENHPQAEILARGLNIDIGMKCDCLLIMGTSLKVDGVKKLVKSLAKSIRERGGKVIFVNKTPLSKQWANLVDFQVLGDCDAFVRRLKTEIPDLFLTQEQLDSKRLLTKSYPLAVKQELTKKFVESIKKEIKLEVKSEPVLTPPSTPSKNRTVLLPKTRKRPSLKRTNTRNANETKITLPSPESSFSDNIKVESESTVTTDCDEDVSLENLGVVHSCAAPYHKRIKIE